MPTENLLFMLALLILGLLIFFAILYWRQKWLGKSIDERLSRYEADYDSSLLDESELSKASVDHKPSILQQMDNALSSKPLKQKGIHYGFLIIRTATDPAVIGQVILLKAQKTRLGSDQRRADIVLPHLAALHAQFIYKKGAFLLVDKGSGQGIWIDGQPINADEPTPLAETARIDFGHQITCDFVTAHLSKKTVVDDEKIASVINTYIQLGILRPLNLSSVYFQGYFPEALYPNQQYSFFVYAHVETEQVVQKLQADIARFEDDLGGSVPPPKIAKQQVQLYQQTAITLVPECDQLEFDPPTFTKRWNGEMVRYNFDFAPPAGLVGETLFVRVSIQVSGIEIAHLKWAVEVSEPAAPRKMALVAPDNPLAAAKLRTHETRTYQKIFVSYSRQDKAVVEAYRFAQMAIGNEVFVDTYSIPPGVDWQAYLAQAIDKADIFQLFWSENAAASPNVHDEWDYALKYRCPDTRCEAFIRPVYWINPMPAPPPPELSHLNFRHVALKPTER
jgi:hypothetical protein